MTADNNGLSQPFQPLVKVLVCYSILNLVVGRKILLYIMSD
jgi:hypothetical protein